MHAPGGQQPSGVQGDNDVQAQLAKYIQEQIAARTHDLWEVSATRDAEAAEMRANFTAMHTGLQEVVNKIQAEFNKLSNRLTALEQRPAAGAPPMPIFSKPPSFDGKMDEFGVWLSQILTFIASNPQHFPLGDRSKVLFVCGYITGTAYTHIQSIAESSHTGPPAPELDDFQAFIAKLKRIFGPVDEAGEAQRRIRELTQGRRSVEEYAAQFNVLAPKTGWEMAPLVSEFNRGLSTDIKKAMIMSKFTDLETLMRTSAEVDAKLRALKASTTPLPRVHGPSSATDPNAMEIGPMRTSVNPRWQLSPEEQKRRQTLGLCFKCGKGPHRVRDCKSAFNPNPTSTASRLAVAAARSTSVSPAEAWTPVQRGEALEADTLAVLSKALELVKQSQDKGKGKEEMAPVAGPSREPENAGF